MSPDTPSFRAQELSALRALVKTPAPGSRLAEASAPLSVTVRTLAPEKSDFDVLQREMAIVARRVVPQPEVFRWLMTLAHENRLALLERFGDATRAPNSDPG